ncbi:MAG: DUF3226 domain-containing protein [Microcystaceae cyanobacterium]
MSLNYSIIGVEGNHDQAFVGKILRRLLGFKDFRTVDKGQEDKLDPSWDKFKPTYPKNGNLYTRLDMPSILFTDTHSVAVYAGEGGNLKQNLEDIISVNAHFQNNLSAFAIIIDADKNNPQSLTQEYSDTFKQYYPHFPTQAGLVSQTSPRTGIYILPDNQHQGVLETILLKCGEIAYPDYLAEAKEYIAKIKTYPRKDYKWKNFDEDKAIIAAVVSLLKPGKTNTVSVSDNRWISQETDKTVTELSNFVEFLKTILNLSYL